MDGASGDRESWVRRAVLSVLLVVGLAAGAYAVVETRSGDDASTAEESDPIEVVTSIERVGDGPLRLGEPLVVGRSGNPVELPADTAESFASALDAGVDYLEASVVMTEDGQLVVRGDHELSTSTDVADRSEFADRETTKTVDGVETTGWFTEDFTLDEIRSLGATEPDPDLRPDSASYDGDYAPIGFDDLLTQLAEFNADNDSEVGLFVRPQMARYFRGEGLPIEPAVAKALRKARLVLEPERVTIESTDLAVLERLEGNLGDNVLSAYVVETDDAAELEASALESLPDTIDAVAVEVGAFASPIAIPEGEDPYDLVDRVHAAGFAIMVYPISYENALLSPGFRSADPDPAARGKIEGQVGALRMIGTDVILAESPVDVIEILTQLEEDSPSPSPSADEG